MIGTCQGFKLSFLLIFIIHESKSSGVIRFTKSFIVVTEGEHLELEIFKTGIAGSDINIAVEILGENIDDFEGSSIALVLPSGQDTIKGYADFIVSNDEIPEKDEIFFFELSVINGDGTVGEPSKVEIIIAANDNAYGIFSLSNTVSVRL